MPRTFTFQITSAAGPPGINDSLLVTARDAERAREIALHLLAKSPYADQIDVNDGPVELFSVTREG